MRNFFQKYFLSPYSDAGHLHQKKAAALLFVFLFALVVHPVIIWALVIKHGSLVHREVLAVVLNGLVLCASLWFLKKGRYHLAANTYTIVTMLIVSATLFNRLQPDPLAGYAATVYYLFIVIGLAALLNTWRVYIGICFFLLIVDVSFFLAAMPGLTDAGMVLVQDAFINSVIAFVCLGVVLAALRYVNIKAIQEAENEAAASRSYSQKLTDLLEESRLAEQARQELQAQFLQAQKMESLGVMAGGVAHDFNNLIHVISGYAQLLMMNKAPGQPDYQELQLIEKTADRAARLINQLLLFSRKADVHKTPISLNHEIESTVLILERTIPKMVDIQLRLDKDLWPINADAVQIEQILLNLGVNAADAMPNGGKLIIETQNILLNDEIIAEQMPARQERHVLISVSDTGCGMDKETLAHIFDPFFTTKEVGRGTGLGLATVYGIVQEHEGHISCYSQPGAGTTFKIYLPAMADGAAVLPVAAIEKRGGTEKILLVDDEATIRNMAAKALQSFGYTVLTAATAEEALSIQASRGEEIDLIILDLGMPGMGGQECLKRLIDRGSRTPVLVASGYGVNGMAAGVIQSGAAGFIGKPYHISHLLAKIREILD